MKKRNIVYYLLLILIMAVLLMGCGYTQEEKAEMKRYEKQGRENAENYIKAKYGIDAKVRELNCEKYNSGPVLIFPFSHWKLCFIRMNYQGEDFLFLFQEKGKLPNGIDDNYQFQGRLSQRFHRNWMKSQDFMKKAYL